MAIIAYVRQPDVDYITVDSVPIPASGALPLPPVTWGWLTDLDFEFSIEGLDPPYYVTAALQPEGSHLEPTRGQIWPRIG